MVSKSDILWSPNRRDQFLVVDNEMTLYKIDRYGVGDLQSVTASPLTRWISNSSTATRLCSSHELSHRRCFDWHPQSSASSSELGVGCVGVGVGGQADLVAVGYANGRVLLTSPSISSSSSTTSSSHLETVGGGGGGIGAPQQEESAGSISGIRVIGKEFIPKHSRPCQSLRWNPRHTQWLAVGLDRHRSDNGIFVWDVFSQSSSSSSIVPGSYEAISASLYHNQPPPPDGQPTPIVIDHRRSHSGLSTLMDPTTTTHPPVAATFSSSAAATQQQHQQQQQQQQHTRALYEFAAGESANSFVWLSHTPKCLVCGLSGKCVRLYDTRDLSRFQLQIPTKAVHGLTVDPFSDQRLCSYVDNQLYLWDLRHAEKPLLVISDQKPYMKIQWDPVRRNVFTSLSKDSSIVKVYHLQQIIAEETELSYTENHVQVHFLFDETASSCRNAPPPSTVVSYDWHPSDECHLLCLSSYGTVSDVWVNERLCAQWSPDGSRLLTSFGKMIAELKHFHLNDEGGATPALAAMALAAAAPMAGAADAITATAAAAMSTADEDIAIVMQRRALLGYGLPNSSGGGGGSSADPFADDSRSLKQNAELCLLDAGPGAENLASTWMWMHKVKQIGEYEQSDTWPYENSFPGVLQVLRCGLGGGGGGSGKSAVGGGSSHDFRQMIGLEPAGGHTAMFRVYTSPERERIIQFCGWGNAYSSTKDRLFSIGGGGGGEDFFQDLLESHQSERAAAIALFTMRLKMAVQILTKAAFSSPNEKNHLQLIALALAGFPGAPADRDQQQGGGGVGGSSGPPLTLNTSSAAMSTAVAAASSTSNNPTSFWVDQCNIMLTKLINPYLKAMFQFLACRSTGGNYEPLFDSVDFPLHDKVAFAAMYASDQRLEELITSLVRQCVATGDLRGLLLTGLGYDQSIDLVQTYVDVSGDVQTGALLIIYGSGAATAGDLTPTSTTSSTAAASLVSAAVRDANTANRIIDGYFTLLDAWGLWHVRAQTNALYLKRSHVTGKINPQVYVTCTYCARSIWAGAGGRMRQRMHKLGSCPSCKKPLPRCALCRLNVGMPLASDQDASKPNKFASWFAWCQSCRHGGHAQHLSDWFTTYSECPVTGCSCKCAALDSLSDFSQLVVKDG